MKDKKFLILLIVLALGLSAGQAMAGGKGQGKGVGAFYVDDDIVCEDTDRESNIICSTSRRVWLWFNIAPENLLLSNDYSLRFYDKGKEVSSVRQVTWVSCSGKYENWHHGWVDPGLDFKLGTITFELTDDSTGKVVGHDTVRSLGPEAAVCLDD